MKYQTYIFDLDGTLLDTLGDLAASVNYALRTHGLPEHSLDDVRRFVGNGVRKLMERAVPDGDAHPEFEAVFATFRQYYMAHSLDTTRPYDGIPETLEALRARGCRLAVVSNKMMAATQALCRHFFPDTIEVAIGEDEAAGIRRKPAPDTVIAAIRELDDISLTIPEHSSPTRSLSHHSPLTSKSSAVYVGDSDVDIETSRNAGLPCISVLWGFRDRDFLIQHGAKTFVSAPSELIQL
jgi:phosphoglycolate phosphatase